MFTSILRGIGSAVSHQSLYRQTHSWVSKKMVVKETQVPRQILPQHNQLDFHALLPVIIFPKMPVIYYCEIYLKWPAAVCKLPNICHTYPLSHTVLVKFVWLYRFPVILHIVSLPFPKFTLKQLSSLNDSWLH